MPTVCVSSVCSLMPAASLHFLIPQSHGNVIFCSEKACRRTRPRYPELALFRQRLLRCGSRDTMHCRRAYALFFNNRPVGGRQRPSSCICDVSCSSSCVWHLFVCFQLGNVAGWERFHKVVKRRVSSPPAVLRELSDLRWTDCRTSRMGADRRSSFAVPVTQDCGGGLGFHFALCMQRVRREALIAKCNKHCAKMATDPDVRHRTEPLICLLFTSFRSPRVS